LRAAPLVYRLVEANDMRLQGKQLYFIWQNPSVFSGGRRKTAVPEYPIFFLDSGWCLSEDKAN
jgi:hypothetical protein